MRVLICGIDGYLGWSLACYLATRGHDVYGLDNGNRARWVMEVGSHSAIPIARRSVRIEALEEHTSQQIVVRSIDMCNYDKLADFVDKVQPDGIVHLAEQPSAPFSMIGQDEAYETQRNNVLGSLNLIWAIVEKCPSAHLVKLGTMGEYGTPPVPIPEGVFPDDAMWFATDRHGTDKPVGSLQGLMFARSPGSYYHCTKVQDSINVEFACRIWKLAATDIMQGVVYGTQIDDMYDDPRLRTRFDFDGIFGTAINRYCAQAAINAPITPFGAGHQKRGFLPLCDSMQCIMLLLENPAEPGEYRTVNQLESVYDLTDLAHKVADVAHEHGSTSKVEHVTNPRIEAEDHFYQPYTGTLALLGYEPTLDMATQLHTMIDDLQEHADRIRDYKDAIKPTVHWARS